MLPSIVRSPSLRIPTMRGHMWQDSMGATDMTPKGTDLLALLIDLLAEQEGVKITYKVVTEE